MLLRVLLPAFRSALRVFMRGSAVIQVARGRVGIGGRSSWFSRDERVQLLGLTNGTRWEARPSVFVELLSSGQPFLFLLSSCGWATLQFFSLPGCFPFDFHGEILQVASWILLRRRWWHDPSSEFAGGPLVCRCSMYPMFPVCRDGKFSDFDFLQKVLQIFAKPQLRISALPILVLHSQFRVAAMIRG